MRPVPQVTKVEPAGRFTLSVTFADASKGIWRPDVAAWKGSMGRPLQDPVYFARAFVDSGAIAWPNGFDASPEAILAEIAAAGTLVRPNYAEAE